MSSEQVGIYLLLLCEEWVRGPLSDEDLCLITSSDISEVRAVLGKCFIETPDGWINLTLEEVRAEQQGKAATRSRAGKAGAKARWTKGRNGDRNATASPTQSDTNGIRVDKSRIEEKEITTTTTTAAAVGDFLMSTGATWRLRKSIADWSDEVGREAKYAGADIPYEIRKCADWHVGKKKRPSTPDIAIRNWLERARMDRVGNTGGDPRAARTDPAEPAVPEGQKAFSLGG